MTGDVCWLEVNTPDAGGAKGFYQGLFGWQDGPGEVGFPYHFLRSPGAGRNFGGIMPQPAGVPPHWLVYFETPDLAAAVATVTQLGGQVRVPEVRLPTGRFAVVADPQGAAFALYQSAAA